MESIRRKRCRTRTVLSFVLRIRRGGLTLIAVGSAILFVCLALWVWPSPEASACRNDEGRSHSTSLAGRPPERGLASAVQQETVPPPPLTDDPAGWPVVVFDPFDDNSNGWDVGEVREEEGVLNRHIGDGVYRWDMDVSEPLLDWILPDFDPLSNLYAAVDVRLAEGTADDIQFGLVLRSPDLRDRYVLYASPTRGVMLRRVADFESDTAIDWTGSELMRPGDWNRLAVLTNGSAVALYVNDQPVAEFVDDLVFEKQVGLMVWVSVPGKFGVDFDNLEIRRANGVSGPPVPEAPATPTPGPTTAPVPECPVSSAIDLEGWPLLVCDTFDDNANAWNVDVSSDDLQTTSRSIDNGTYTWDIRAFQPMSHQTLAGVDAVSDFYAAIDARRAKGPQSSTEYGLQFRFQESGDRYMFVVSEGGELALYRMDDGKWTTLIKSTPTDAVTPGAWNRVAVQAVGPRLVFFVNDKAVAHFEDDTYSEGRLLPAIQIGAAGDAIVEFDNFEVRRAPDDAALTPVPALAIAPTPAPTEELLPTAMPSDTPIPPPTPAAIDTPRPTLPLPAPDAAGRLPLSTSSPVDWPVLMSDTFDDNANEWFTEPAVDEVAAVASNVSGGVFAWDLEAYTPFLSPRLVNLDPISDFYMAADFFVVEDEPTDVEYGFQFRVQSPEDMYRFKVTNAELFGLVRILEGETTVLAVDDLPSGLLLPGQWNRLAVLALGPTIIAYVNDQEVVRVTDPFVPRGTVFLVTQITRPVRAGVYVDNFEVRQAPADAVLAPTPLPVVTACPNSPSVAPGDWVIIACDTFDVNGYGWREGSDFEEGLEKVRVIDGTYSYAFKAEEQVYSWDEPNLPAVSDFFVSVQAGRNSLMDSTSYGLVFRMQDYNNFFGMTIDGQQRFRVIARIDGWFRTLIEPTHNPAIRADGVNSIAVRGEGRHFTFYVNDVVVAEMDDIHFKEGRVGVIIEPARGDQGNVEFDDLEVRVPPEQAGM